MFSRKLDRQRADQPIMARTLNRMMDAVDRLSRLQAAAPLQLQDLPNGPFLSLAMPPQLILGKVGGSSIGPWSSNVPGSGSVTLWNWDGTNTGTGYTSTVTAKNWTTQTIAANKNCVLFIYNDDYWVLVWDCG